MPTQQFVGTSSANGFGDFVAQTDATVGAVLAALAAGGFADNTIVIFSADNGPERYAYERVRKYGHRRLGPLRGLKRDLWEGGHRVPFIVRWPGHVPAGRVENGLVSQIDLFATLAGIVGGRIPAGSAKSSVLASSATIPASPAGGPAAAIAGIAGAACFGRGRSTRLAANAAYSLGLQESTMI